MNSRMRIVLAISVAAGCCLAIPLQPSSAANPFETDADHARASPVSLLHRSSALTRSKGSVHVRSGAKTMKDHKHTNPTPRGHMLTDHELKPIDSVACLQARQRNPAVNCSDSQSWALSSGWGGVGGLNAGNYPSWKDPICHNDGKAYFCDPENLLNTSEREELIETMKKERESQYVTCGPQLQHDVIDRWNYQPFYLGVAIAEEWPLHEADAGTLQHFGRILAGRWNMTFPWDGNPAFYARCPNEAILIILPKYRQAYLSSASCMFLCQEKGGPEVATATLQMLDRGGLLAGAKAGVAQVYNTFKETSPEHPLGWEPSENTSATWGGMPYGGRQYSLKDNQSVTSWTSSADWIWNLTQRFVFVITLVLLFASIIMACLVCYKAPGQFKELNNRVV